ncbi:hypothetical protein AURDEDRAFT_172557 [Auricularia subglabra TFB-10046 SS5]|nr:hypothetical protein AURDEDRAFT_172557 [Auricularia subglabra TFB-10046 SS5]
MPAGLDNYAHALVRFREWAATERLPKSSRRLPLPEPVLCAFAASHAGVYSAGAARSAIAGLRYAHDKDGLAWAGSPRLSRILEAVAQKAPPSSRRPERLPVTLAMVDEALVKLNLRRDFDQCVAAALLVAFWGQMRLSEILSPMRRYDFAKLPARKHLTLRADAGGPAQQETTAIWLPMTKTARKGEYVWLTRHFNDRSYALQEHLRDNRISRDDALFAYRDSHNDLIALTKGAFLSRLNEIWAEAGMKSVSGHCFRIRGTTALLKMGVDTEIVKMSGRWKKGNKKTRALKNNDERAHTTAMGALLLGAAAFDRQGAVYETMGIRSLPYYGTGGTVSIALNDEFAALGCEVLGKPVHIIIVMEVCQLFLGAMAGIERGTGPQSATAETKLSVLVMQAYEPYGNGDAARGVANIDQAMAEALSFSSLQAPPIL